MIVYVVSSGEKSEGGDVGGVFKTPEKAKAVALGIKCCFDGGWIEVESHDSEFVAVNGCHYISVKSYEVT